MVRCAAIGQSNSVAKDGFLRYLTEHSDIEIVRSARLGASPSVLAPYLVNDGFFSDCDFCIIDLAVVDASAVQESAYHYRSAFIWTEWACHMARRAGCQPVILAIPVAFSALTDSVIIRMSRELAQSLQCYYLDVCDLVRKTLANTKQEVSSLYKDSAHPNAAFSCTIAGALADFLRKAPRLAYRSEETTYAFKDMRTINLAECAPALVSRVQYSTSILSFNGVRVMRGESVPIRTGRIDGLHGVMVNTAQCHRKVAFEGVTRVVKSLNLRPYGPTTFEARLIPINSPLRDRAGTVTISIAGIDEPSTERTMHERTDFPESRDFVELSDLLIETGTRLITYIGAIPVATELNIARMAS